MKSFIRSAVRQLAPPVFVTVSRRVLRRSGRSEWQFAGYAWPVQPRARGWNVSSVVDAQRSRWSALQTAVGGVGPITSDGLAAHNKLACFGYVVGLASLRQRRVSILDWGGGLGQYGLIAQGMFPELEISYHCHDLPLMTAVGRELLPEAHFHENEEETFAESYDVVMASSSLQYSQDWRSTLLRLANSTRRYLYVTRQPFVINSRSFVVMQRPYSHGYETEYFGWVLDRGRFVGAAESAGMTLRREFLVGEEPYIPGAPEQPVYRGFLFERADAAGGR